MGSRLCLGNRQGAAIHRLWRDLAAQQRGQFLCRFCSGDHHVGAVEHLPQVLQLLVRHELVGAVVRILGGKLFCRVVIAGQQPIVSHLIVWLGDEPRLDDHRVAVAQQSLEDLRVGGNPHHRVHVAQRFGVGDHFLRADVLVVLVRLGGGRHRVLVVCPAVETEDHGHGGGTTVVPSLWLVAFPLDLCRGWQRRLLRGGRGYRRCGGGWRCRRWLRCGRLARFVPGLRPWCWRGKDRCGHVAVVWLQLFDHALHAQDCVFGAAAHGRRKKHDVEHDDQADDAQRSNDLERRLRVSLRPVPQLDGELAKAIRARHVCTDSLGDSGRERTRVWCCSSRSHRQLRR